MYHSWIKHIDVMYHKIGWPLASEEILLEKFHAFENTTDMLTKSVAIYKFKHGLDLLHVSQC